MLPSSLVPRPSSLVPRPSSLVPRPSSLVPRPSLTLNLSPLGSKIHKRTKQQQTRKEKEHQKVHQGALNGGSHIPSLFQVEQHRQGNYYEVSSSQSQIQ